MSELPSAMFSIADGNEFRVARFYIVCEAIRLEALESPLIVCACRTFPRWIVKAWQRQGICCLVRAAVFCYNGERKRGGSRVKIHFFACRNGDFYGEKETTVVIEEENYSICHPVLGCPDRGIFCIYHQLLPEGNH